MTMDNTGYISLSHQMALQRQMEVIANNIANASTSGYKADETLFEEFLHDGGIMNGIARKLSFVQDYGTLVNFATGPIEHTGNDYDIALSGPGFLVAETPQGRVYTRGGHLTTNDRGELATVQGHPILAADNGTILIEPEGAKVIINADNTIAIGDQAPFKLKVVDFDNPQFLKRQGRGYFVTTQPERESTTTRTLQHMVEGSNVEPILQLTAMIDTSRAYQHSLKLMETEHDLQRKVADVMPKLNR